MEYQGVTNVCSTASVRKNRIAASYGPQRGMTFSLKA